MQSELGMSQALHSVMHDACHMHLRKQGFTCTDVVGGVHVLIG